jgi:bacillithiol synthase
LQGFAELRARATAFDDLHPAKDSSIRLSMALVECGLTTGEASRLSRIGEERVRSECLPFSQIPHTTKFFLDYLSGNPKALQFYPRSANFKSWMKDEAAKVACPDDRRLQVAAVLEKQNRSFGASAKTFENIERLRNGALALVTGQQVGLFGGPLFSLLKALTAVRLADEATKAGIDCVPVFWLATEDHDLEEVSSASLLTAEGTLKKFHVASQGVDQAPVGTLNFGEDIQALVDEVAQMLGDGDTAEALRKAYRRGENFGSSFARLFASIFADFGVILLDGRDAELHHIAKPMYRAAAEQAEKLDRELLARGKELEAAGYHQQVKVTASSTPLFYMGGGARIVVHRKLNSDESEFIIGEERVSKAELARRIDERPQDFSANVLLRPVIQDYLLPTLAYAGGAAEVAYFAQVAVVYRALLGRVTAVVPRFSATLIEAKPQSFLAKYDLRVQDVFQGPEKLLEQLAERALPADLQAAFAKADSAIEKSVKEIQEALGRLDPTLVEAAGVSISKMRYQLDKIKTQAARAESSKKEVLQRKAHVLSNILYPNHGLQEREIAGIFFLARHPQLLQDLYATIDLDCPEHHLIWLT